MQAVWRVLTQATGYYGEDGGGCFEAGEIQEYHWLVERVDDSDLATLDLEPAE